MGIEAISKDVMLLIFYKGDDVIFDNPSQEKNLIKILYQILQDVLNSCKIL